MEVNMEKSKTMITNKLEPIDNLQGKVWEKVLKFEHVCKQDHEWWENIHRDK